MRGPDPIKSVRNMTPNFECDIYLVLSGAFGVLYSPLVCAYCGLSTNVGCSVCFTCHLYYWRI